MFFPLHCFRAKAVPEVLSIQTQTKYCLLQPTDRSILGNFPQYLTIMKPTCRVPNGDVVGTPLLEEESSSDGAQRVFKAPLRVSVEKRRLPNVHVSQNDHLNIRLPDLSYRRHCDRYFNNATIFLEDN